MSHCSLDVQVAKAMLIADDLWQNNKFRRDKSLQLLSNIYENIKNNPNEKKYRKLHINQISSKHDTAPQVKQILLCSGFIANDDGVHFDLNDNNLTLCISVGDMLQNRINDEKIKQKPQKYFNKNNKKQFKPKHKDNHYHKYNQYKHHTSYVKQQNTGFGQSHDSHIPSKGNGIGGIWSWDNNGNWEQFEWITSKQIDDGIRNKRRNTNKRSLSIPLTKGKYFSQYRNRNDYFCIVQLDESRTKIQNIYQKNSKTNNTRSMKRDPPFQLHPYIHSKRNNSKPYHNVHQNKKHDIDGMVKSIGSQIPETFDLGELLDVALPIIAANNGNNDNNTNARCKLDVEHCGALKRSIDALRKYEIYIECKQANINIVDIFGYDYDIVGLLNDYQHLMFHHGEQFEDIYNRINNGIYNNKGCNLSTCSLLKRNRRDTAHITENEMELKKLYGENDIVEQQLFDMIHCNYMHSFDSGRRLTRNEKLLVLNEQKESDDDSINYKSVHDIIKSKDGSSMTEQKETNSKFNAIEYRYGYRFYYWDYYITTAKNNVRYDFAAPIAIRNNRSSPLEKTVADWYIKPKYKNFKHEIISNAICTLGQNQWNNILGKASQFIRSNKAKKMQCLRTKSAKCYEMKTGDPVQQKHLIALIIYTDYDTISAEFSSTFRKQTDYETFDQLKERHRNYYFCARNLRECVEVFGMACSSDSNFIVYHGINRQMTFASVYPYIKGPFSTTTDYAVALNFCANEGMILGIKINVNEWRMKLDINRMNCMDCEWISAHGNEQEILFLGGVNRHTFQTIIDAKLNINYCEYVKGLRQMTYCMSNCNVPLDNLNADRPESSREKQMVFRLMSHELYRYPQFHNEVCRYKTSQKLANQFKSCPQYFSNILHEHCINIKGIVFYDVLYFKYKGKKKNFVFDQFFQRQDGWIYLDRLTTVFPKLDVVGFHVDNPEIIKNALTKSVLPFIRDNKISPLKEIMIHIDEKKERMENDISKYVDVFRKFGWRLRVRELHIDKLEPELGIHFDSLDPKLIRTLGTELHEKVRDSLNRRVKGIEIEIKKK